MSGRSTVYNAGLTENWDGVNKKNKGLLKDFIDYCKSIDRSDQTCLQYEAQLKIFFCYCQKEFEDKFFIDMRKREFVKFFGSLQNELGMSPNRIASLKSALSSMSNYIENILDDEFPTFKNIVKGIPIAQKQTVREKTVLTEEEVNDCLSKLVELKKYEVACFFAFAVYSGARKAEVLQVRVDDFTDEHKVLNGKYWLTAPMRTKGRGRKGKILRKYVEIESFKPYLDLWMKQREELGIDNELLFTVYKQGKYQPAIISTANSWAEIISRVTGKDYYNHVSRHVFTTLARRNKVPDTVIQKMVGWQSLDLINVYDDRDDTEELEEYFSREGDIKDE